MNWDEKAGPPLRESKQGGPALKSKQQKFIMNSIKDIVLQVIEDISLHKPETQTKIQRVWKSVLNDKEYNHTKVFDFKDGILLIYADSPPCLYQMNLKKKKILECLQEEIPEIKNIQLKIGKIK